MMMFGMLFFVLLGGIVQISHANDAIVSDIGPVSLLSSNGTFARVFVQDGRFRIALGSQSRLFVADLIEGESGSQWQLEDKRELVSLNDQRFNDWGVVLCPDQSLAVTASFDSVAPNDSAYHWLVDSSENLVGSGYVATASNQWQFNDPASVCTENIVAVGSSIQGFSYGNWIFPMFEGQVAQPFEIQPQFRLNGGGLFDDGDRIIHVGIDYGTPMKVNIYDADWNWQHSHDISLLQDDSLRAYWPQGLTRHGDHYLVAFMGRDENWGEGDQGDVFVAVFDLDWNLIEEVRLTNYESNAAMRPWIACLEGQCLVSFDVDTTHAAVPFSIVNDARGSGGSNGKIDSCGCQSGGVAVLWLPLVLMIRRRGRASRFVGTSPHDHSASFEG